MLNDFQHILKLRPDTFLVFLEKNNDITNRCCYKIKMNKRIKTDIVTLPKFKQLKVNKKKNICTTERTRDTTVNNEIRFRASEIVLKIEFFNIQWRLTSEAIWLQAGLDVEPADQEVIDQPRQGRSRHGGRPGSPRGPRTRRAHSEVVRDHRIPTRSLSPSPNPYA